MTKLNNYTGLGELRVPQSQAAACSGSSGWMRPPHRDIAAHRDRSEFALHTSGGLKHLPHTFTASKNVRILLKEDTKQTNESISYSSLSENDSL